MHGNLDTLGYDGTESCPFHDNVSLCSSTDANNLQTNMLSLSITIRPDHQCVGVSGLSEKVVFDSFLVLINCGFNWRVEQLESITRVPFPMCLMEVTTCQMPRNTSDRKN
jgi:hypothetical protein